MKKKIDETSRNALWLMAGRCFQLGIQLLTGLWVARYLGPEHYGLLSYAGACTALAASFCQLGLPATLVKELTDAPDREGEILGTALVLRFLSSLVCAGCILLATESQTIVALAALGMVLQIADSLQAWFLWRRQSRITAAAMLAGSAAGAAWKLSLLILGKGVTWFALATAIDHAAVGILFLLFYQRKQGKPLRFSPALGRSLLGRSWHFILPGLLASACAQLDRVLLRHLAGEVQVGLYAAAVTLSSAWGFVLSAIIDAAYPGIASCQQDPLRFSAQNRRLYALVFSLSAGVSLVITLLAGPGIRLLYGADYGGAVLPLQILTWSTGFSYLGVARNVWVVCRNAQKDLIWVYAAGAAVSLGLNLLLIPQLGAVGAAISALAAQMVTAIAAPFVIPSLRENGIWMLQGICLRGIWEETS